MATQPKSLLVFGGKKYVIETLLSLMKTAPLITINRDEIETNPDKDHVPHYPEETAWREAYDARKAPVALYKFGGKYIVLAGDVPEKGDKINGRFVTKHILKRAEYVSEEEIARSEREFREMRTEGQEERPYGNRSYRPEGNRFRDDSRVRNPVFQQGMRKP